MGGGKSYQEGLKAALDLDEAMDYIDRIFSARILGIYGVTLALNISTAEFDQIMNLKEKPLAHGLDSMFLDIFISVLEHVPIAGQAFEAAQIAGEAAHHIAKVLKGAQTTAKVISEASAHFQEDGRQVDSLEPDEDAMKIIQSRSSKMPLFKSVLWARYQVEYDRRAARERFRTVLRAALDKGHFVGKPVDLARKEFGPAPNNLQPKDVYQNLEDFEKTTLRELIRAYVRKYVSVERWVRHLSTGGVSDNWVVLEGLNQPQWDAIYARFGKKLDKRIEAARRLQFGMAIAYQLASAMGIHLKPLVLQEPILGGVEDLYRFWGARFYYSEDSWYGKSTAFLQKVDASPVM